VTPALTVLIPCLNEEGNVPRLASELLPALEALDLSWEAVLVDDGSTDGTAQALSRLTRADARLRVLSHPSNRGLGAALRTGLAAAAGEWTVVLDADLTFPPTAVAVLLAEQRRTGADCVSGSPLLGAYAGVPWTRALPSRTLNLCYQLLFDRRLTSWTPLFRLYRTDLLRGLPLRSDGFEISAEILALLVRRGAKVAEVPASLGVRTWGASKLRRLRELGRHARLVGRLLAPPH